MAFVDGTTSLNSYPPDPKTSRVILRPRKPITIPLNTVAPTEPPVIIPTGPKVEITVIGHKSPDLDTIVCALVEAAEKNAMSSLKGKNKVYIPKITGSVTASAESILQLCKVTPSMLGVETNLAGKKVILVDHNSEDESLKGLSEASIVNIIDHHRMVLKTKAATKMRIEPFGAAATIVAKKILAKLKRFPRLNTQLQATLPEWQKLLLAAMIDDTDGFNSPTTTKHDRRIAMQLAALAGINLKEFTETILDKSTTIAGIPFEKLARSDGKAIGVGKEKFQIGQIKIMDQAQLNGLTNEQFMTELAVIAQEKKTDGAALMITDIKKQHTQFLVYPANHIAFEKAFSSAKKTPVGNGVMYDLPAVVSRKLDIVPKLEKAAAEDGKEDVKA